MKPPLRILEVCTSRSWGGMEMQVLKTSKALAERGHSVWLLCFPHSSLQQEAAAAGIRCLSLPFKNGIHFGEILRLRKALKDQPVEIIHTQFSRDLRFIVPAIEGFAPRIPIVLTKRVGSSIRKKDILHRYLYSRVDLVTTISHEIQQNVIDSCPIDAARVEVLFNGLSIDRFSRAAVERNTIRQNFEVRPNDLVVGMVGRFSPGKGHEEFLQAAKSVVTRRNHVFIWIVGEASYGENDYAQKIKGLSKTLGLDDKVRFTGFRRDIPEIMNALDILVVPSHAEAFGNVAIEGMAAGLPVVATNSAGLVDIVQPNLTGLLVPPQDSHGLAEAILQLVDHPEQREKFGHAGREYVAIHFDETKQFEKLENMFHRINRPVGRFANARLSLDSLKV